MKEVIIETTIYEAVDGQRFAIKSECQAHERKLDVRKYLRFYDKNNALLSEDYFDNEFDPIDIWGIVAENELAETALMENFKDWSLIGIQKWLEKPTAYPRVFVYSEDEDAFVDVAMVAQNLRTEAEEMDNLARKLVETK